MSYELSVIIPVYNVEKYIGECLDSVVNQSIGIDNIEVIVVNDATPDNSMDIINEYVEKYPSFKVISNKSNKGLGESRNIGLKYVTSDYVTFLDSDDFISQNAYEDSVSKINLSKLGLSANAGECKINKEISVFEECKLINQSVTGLYENENDLLTV